MVCKLCPSQPDCVKEKGREHYKRLLSGSNRQNGEFCVPYLEATEITPPLRVSQYFEAQ